MLRLRSQQDQPSALLDLSRLSELRGWRDGPDRLWVGAGTTYAEIALGLDTVAPALAEALRHAGPPQIRNRATIGGALGAALPTGSCHPALLATRATVEVVSVRGTRLIPARAFYASGCHNTLAPDELIHGVLIPKATGPQRYLQVSIRRSASPAISSFALSVQAEDPRVGTGIGGGSVPVSAGLAEHYLSDWLEASGRRTWPTGPPQRVVARFGDLAMAAANPADDAVIPAGYRRQAVAVLARRALLSCWASPRAGGP
jgi:CO/xanthine dehydrogenase FAD-binding subunit